MGLVCRKDVYLFLDIKGNRYIFEIVMSSLRGGVCSKWSLVCRKDVYFFLDIKGNRYTFEIVMSFLRGGVCSKWGWCVVKTFTFS